jgi:hypothetical protein
VHYAHGHGRSLVGYTELSLLLTQHLLLKHQHSLLKPLPADLHLLAAQVEIRRPVLQRRNRKAKIRLRRVRILERVPERVPLAKQTAADLLPVPLAVLGAGDGVARNRSNARPSSLCDPDLLPVGDRFRLRDGVAEVLGCEVDAVGFCGLEVREARCG